MSFIRVIAFSSLCLGLFAEETTSDRFSLTLVRCWCYSRRIRVFKHALSFYFTQAWRRTWFECTEWL